MQEPRFNGKQLKNLMFSFLSWVILSLFFLIRYSGGFERLIINLFLILLFAALLLCLLVNERGSEKETGRLSEDYREFFWISAGSAGVVLVSSFLPHYIAPFLMISFLYARLETPRIGMITSSLLASLFVINSGGSVYELACYVILSCAGAILMPLYEKKKNRPLLSFIILCVTVLVPGILSYLPDGFLKYPVILICIVFGILTDLLFLLLFDRMRLVEEQRPEVEVRTIVKENYPLVREIREFSPEAYSHAKKVSLIAAKCAAASGLDASVSAAGGFYYRLGILSGDPVIENGVKIAEYNCFPQKVIRILQEYNGEEAEISTPESALVNIADTLVRQFEKRKGKIGESEWNREILIYQTLNDRLGTGMYDHSGLSINQYLKVREFLVRGDDLA